MEAGAVLVVGSADGRLSLGAHLALCRDVGYCGFHFWPPGYGRAAWMGEFPIYAHGLEKQPRIYAPLIYDAMLDLESVAEKGAGLPMIFVPEADSRELALVRRV